MRTCNLPPGVHSYDAILAKRALGIYRFAEVRTAAGHARPLIGITPEQWSAMKEEARRLEVALYVIGSRVSGPRTIQKRLHPALEAGLPLFSEQRSASATYPRYEGLIEKTAIKELGRENPHTSDLTVLIAHPIKTPEQMDAAAMKLEQAFKALGCSFPIRVFSSVFGRRFHSEADVAELLGDLLRRHLPAGHAFSPEDIRRACEELYAEGNAISFEWAGQNPHRHGAVLWREAMSAGMLLILAAGTLCADTSSLFALLNRSFESHRMADTSGMESKISQEEEQIKRWIEDLGEYEIGVRDEATWKLIDNFSKAKPWLDAFLRKTDDAEIKHRLEYILKEGPRDPRARILEKRLSLAAIQAAPQIADEAFSSDEKILQEVLRFNKGGETMCGPICNPDFEEKDMSLIAEAVASNLRGLKKDWTRLEQETKRLLLDNMGESWGIRAARESRKELRGLLQDRELEIRAAAEAALKNSSD